MQGFYVATFAATATTVARDFFELSPVSNRRVEIVALDISQTTEIGDAQEEMIEWAIIRGHTTSGSGGSTSTPRSLDRGGVASGITSVEVMNTTIASGGTTNELWRSAFNVRTGLQWIAPPEIRPSASAGDTTIVVRMITTPADSISFTGTIVWWEPA